MTLLLVGLALLAAWPLYNFALVLYTARDGVSGGRHRRSEPNSPTGYEPKVFWIVVPCLNEERVVGQTVRNALAMNGPLGTRTRVLVVDDGSDDGTPAVLDAIEDPNLHVLRRNLPDARKGKGEALNAAFRYIRAQAASEGTDPDLVAVGVIDGDGRGSRNMLTEVSRVLQDPKVGAVQCRVRIHNRNKLLAAMQDLEFACIANASQAMRNSLGTVGLGGNGQFARLSALDLLGDAPWSACLVEDLELGLRLHLMGTRIRYISRASVTQQGLVDVRRLLRQRTRWAQGNLQCIRYVPKLWKADGIPNSALIEMLYYLLGPWFNAFGTVAMTALATYSLVLAAHHGAMTAASGTPMLATAGVWAVAMVAPFLMWGLLHRMQLRDEKLHRCLLAGLCYPAFLFLGLLSTYRAIGRQMARRNTWAKTERLAEEPTEAAPAIGATTARATTAGQTLVAALAPRQAEPSISADRLAQVMSVLNGAR
jgi:cellulose synthase/poly-beta-1,6-N-acetylglucosamine synthase-like glycosyltransferase